MIREVHVFVHVLKNIFDVLRMLIISLIASRTHTLYQCTLYYY